MSTSTSSKAIPTHDSPPIPPASTSTYIIPQLSGELVSIPGSKSVFRILASEKQTGDDSIGVFSSGGALADAPGFHHHERAHDIFMVTKGELKLWVGDSCRILQAGDFASIPPKIIHNPHLLGPITETYGLIHPSSWIDFFRYVSEPTDIPSIIYPEQDSRSLPALLVPKVIAAAKAGKDYDVHFHREHVGCEVAPWSDADTVLPDGEAPYYLRANRGPRWILGGVVSRPFITGTQSSGKFAITSLEGSSHLDAGLNPLAAPLRYAVHHVLVVMEGKATINVEGYAPATLTEGETVFVQAGVAWGVVFESRFVRIWSFSSGDGVERVIERAGRQYTEGYVVPDKAESWDAQKFEEVCKELQVKAA
ncbi:putative dioxygenase [Pseudovirgaria hyperparasitica]|uniref:Dioxygenase n=1 Tax=Pseudovirgaria hyperparasitica TaxID=470096 RepID=A0A6A6WIK9_9PEZI|nr:putative dioxygenase [Pseudovirgaria hyperparasitica]KAF2762119.1 putative dioxygenase [Pseudovirgaria hyperparasitica]